MTTGHEESGATHGVASGHGASGGHGATSADAEGAQAGGDAPAHGADGHGPEPEELGPVDYAAWAAGIVGVAVGLLTAACFALATAPIGR